MLLVAIVGTSFLFPRSKYFNYEYTKSLPWNFENLAAPYDYSLLKSAELIEKEKARIEKDFIPLFQYNDQIKDQVLGEIVQQNLLKEKELRFLSTKYKEGIYDQVELDQYPNERIETYIAGKEQTNRKALLNTTSKILNKLSDVISQDTMQLVNSILEPNVKLNSEANNKAISTQVESIDVQKGIVKKGEAIVRTGDIVSEDIELKLNSLKEAYANDTGGQKGKWVIFLGYFLLTCLIYGALLYYLKSYYPAIYDNNLKLLFILIWPFLLGFLVYFIENNSELSTYLIPFCIAPIVIANFYSSRLAFFVHIVVVLIASFLSKLGYEFTFLQILAGIATVLYVSETRYWNLFFKAIGIILGTYLLGYLGLELIKEGDFSAISYKIFGWLFMNGIFLLLAYPFIPIIEKIFGFTSSISLAELSDLNNPLLKDLSIKAPGTFQHSLQVANLAEAAVKKLNGNSLLTKVAALYHDIGKMKQPEYYIENQSNIESPHGKLSNFESAKIIIDHVIEGEKMAKKAKLPQVIIDFITTHHGNSRVEYFYRNQLKDYPDQEFDESLFRYPGPLPTTKEESVLMIADSMEAASKSLKSPTGQDIDKLVDNIVKSKIDSGLLTDSELTFNDLNICKDTFKSLLRSIYHVRIEYPEEVKKTED